LPLAKLAVVLGGLIAVVTIASILTLYLTAQNTAVGRTYYSTQIGERMFVLLEDNLTVSLNTASHIAVDFAGHQHRVHLLSGEVVFRANQTSRGLQVTIGDFEIYGLGGTFDVHRSPFGTRVTVIDGQIRLQCACFDARLYSEGDTPSHPGVQYHTSVNLTAGDQLLIDRDREGPRFHRRSLTSQERERLVAWKDGHLVFQGQTLSEVVAEFNRYSRRQLSIDDNSIRRLTIGGVFSTDDVDSFIAALHAALGVIAMPPDSRHPDHNVIRLVRDPK